MDRRELLKSLGFASATLVIPAAVQAAVPVPSIKDFEVVCHIPPFSNLGELANVLHEQSRRIVSCGSLLNCPTERSRFRTEITPILEMAKRQRLIDDHLIVCDNTNNSPIIVDDNKFVADFYMKDTTINQCVYGQFINHPHGSEFSFHVLGL